MNSDFDSQLKAAMQRREPSPGFADRVMIRLPAHRRRSPWMLWAAPLAASLMLAAGVWDYHEQQAARAAASQRAVVFALRLTAQKLTDVNRHINKITVRREEL